MLSHITHIIAISHRCLLDLLPRITLLNPSTQFRHDHPMLNTRTNPTYHLLNISATLNTSTQCKNPESGCYCWRCTYSAAHPWSSLPSTRRPHLSSSNRRRRYYLRITIWYCHLPHRSTPNREQSSYSPGTSQQSRIILSTSNRTSLLHCFQRNQADNQRGHTSTASILNEHS